MAHRQERSRIGSAKWAVAGVFAVEVVVAVAAMLAAALGVESLSYYLGVVVIEPPYIFYALLGDLLGTPISLSGALLLTVPFIILGTYVLVAVVLGLSGHAAYRNLKRFTAR